MLICILACSLGFHAITLERSTFTKLVTFKIEPVQHSTVWYCYFVVLLRVLAENVVTDRQTHTNEPSTVTLAAHAR